MTRLHSLDQRDSHDGKLLDRLTRIVEEAMPERIITVDTKAIALRAEVAEQVKELLGGGK